MPTFLPAFAHLLVSKPWVDTERECIGITYVVPQEDALTPAPISAAAVRAFIAHGSPVAVFPGGARFVALSADPWLPEFDGGEGWRSADRAASPLAFESIRATMTGPAARWEVELIGASRERFAGRVALDSAGGSNALTVDLSDELRALALAALGGVREITLRAWDASDAPLDIARAELARRVPTILTNERFDGRTVRGMPTIQAPRVESARVLRLILMADSVVISQDVAPGVPVVWSAPVAAWMATRTRVSRWRKIYYFFDRGPGGNGRSELDWWTIDDE